MPEPPWGENETPSDALLAKTPGWGVRPAEAPWAADSRRRGLRARPVHSPSLSRKRADANADGVGAARMWLKSTILNRNEPKLPGECSLHLAKCLIFQENLDAHLGLIIAVLLR